MGERSAVPALGRPPRAGARPRRRADRRCLARIRPGPAGAAGGRRDGTHAVASLAAGRRHRRPRRCWRMPPASWMRRSPSRGRGTSPSWARRGSRSASSATPWRPVSIPTWRCTRERRRRSRSRRCGGWGSRRLSRRGRRVYQRRHDLQPDRAGGSAGAGTAGCAQRRAGRPAGAGVLLGRGPLLDRARGRAAGYGHPRRAGNSDRRPAANAFRPAGRGHRCRYGGRRLPSRSGCHSRHHPDRRHRSVG